MDEWATFFAHALDRRLPTDKLEQFAKVLSTKSRLATPLIAELLLRPSESRHYDLDPQVSLYAQALLRTDVLDVPSVLRALLRHSTSRPVDAAKEEQEVASGSQTRWIKSYGHEERLVYGLSKIVAAGDRPKSAQEALGTANALTEWMRLLVMANAADDMMREIGAGNDTHNQETMAVRVAVGALLVALAENATVNETLRNRCPKDTLKGFSQSLANFTPLLINGSSMFAERLELYTKTLVALEPIDKKAQKAGAEIDQIIDSAMALGMDNIPVVDIPTMNSRAGLYVYLNSMLTGRPMVDDNQLLNFLHNRYQGDIQTKCIDLVVSSFDILANAIFRSENPQTTFLLRSFLINKVPLLISMISAPMFPPLSPELCITEALSHVDTNAFPTFSSMFDDTSAGDMFSDSVRQDFCFSCCLHGLIPEESIERLLGEIPMQTLPAGGRYTKDEVLEQCLSDSEKIEAFTDELEHMDGNVGAVSQAITELLRRLCESKDTMALKSLCAHLARKPSSLDVLLIFDKPLTILPPICQLLDAWRYDDDQGEYQPVYEEFGSILLLVLAFVYRYDLSATELGVQTPDSFIAKLLVRGSTARLLDDLSSVESSQLDGWIKGLFNAEGGGLGDEPMALCPPQDFYLLVPTLFSQIVLASQHGHLTDDVLRGGLEYLLDPSLLPSLIPALLSLTSNILTTPPPASLLQALILPQSISAEASLLHNAILPIPAPHLSRSLRALQRSVPTRTDLDPLIAALRPHLHFSRTAIDLTTDFPVPPNLPIAVRHAARALINWNPPAAPPNYPPRLPVLAIRMLGARRALLALLEELGHQCALGNSGTAYDVVASLVCAPPKAAAGVQGRVTLREALATEAAKVGAEVGKEGPEAERAEVVVRLYRRVEALSAGGGIDEQAGLMSADLGIGGVGGEGLVGEDMMGVLSGEGMMGLEGGMLDDMKLDF
ncbi:hypothetical protein VE02_08695 [Pseudogymnoascus sp. 03VT05]|nr:hypothetical protein VE02_08695 [Pseudogymnoascus sp. 03VT05]